MAIPTNETAIGGSTKKSQYDALYDNAILADTGGTAGGAQTIPGEKTFSDILMIALSDPGGSFGANDLLRVRKTGTNVNIGFLSDNDQASAISFHDVDASGQGAVRYDHATDVLDFKTGGTYRLKIANDDIIGIGGYASGANRDAYLYFATDAYFQWDETEDVLILVGKNFFCTGDEIRLAGGAGGSNRDAYLYFASDGYLFWDETESALIISPNLRIDSRLEFDTSDYFSYNTGSDILSLYTGSGTPYTWDSTCFTSMGTIKIRERAAAIADTAAHGQLWVKNATPCQLWFTDDAGSDTQIV
jgi:hypothetical protein